MENRLNVYSYKSGDVSTNSNKNRLTRRRRRRGGVLREGMGGEGGWAHAEKLQLRHALHEYKNLVLYIKSL